VPLCRIFIRVFKENVDEAMNARKFPPKSDRGKHFTATFLKTVPTLFTKQPLENETAPN
jgi:hypothetical protein